MALFSSDNNDKKLSQGSSVKSSSLLSSKNADGTASNRATSTVKTLNPRSSSPFAAGMASANNTGTAGSFTASRSSAFSSTLSKLGTTASSGASGGLGVSASASGSSAQSSTASRFQSGSALNRTAAGSGVFRSTLSQPGSSATSSLNSTARAGAFSANRPAVSATATGSTLSAPRPSAALSSLKTASGTAKPSVFSGIGSTQTGTGFTQRTSALSSGAAGTVSSTLRTSPSGSSFASKTTQGALSSAGQSSLTSGNSDFTRKLEQAKAALSTVPKVRPISINRDGRTSLVTEKQEVTDVQYRRFAAFIEEKCGIVLGDGKQYLVNSRLSSLLGKFRVQTVDDLINKAMEERPNNKVQEEVIDAMTTNETLWFRDTYPYRALETIILPELAKKAKYPVRIWSAACSSGQEPYSIGMIIQEQMSKMLHIDPKQTQIIGTDLSPEMLSICRRGQYDVHALSRGLSPERKEKFFRPTHNPNMMAIDSRVKSMVEFRPMNLLGSYALMGRFDVIFCRNVLIYFSNDVKADILRKLTMCLNPGGYLILGSTETLVGVADKYEMMRCNPGIIYHLKPQKYAF